MSGVAVEELRGRVSRAYQWARRVGLLSWLFAAAILALFFGYVRLNELDLDKFRSYGGMWTTDLLPLKETQFFVAVMLLGGGATWFMTLGLLRAGADRLVRIARWCHAHPRTTVAIAAGFALVATALVSWLALQHSPVLLDEMDYLFQVDLLSHGHLFTKPPEPLEPFKDFYLLQAPGVWSGIYPWGHVAFLLPGYWLGFPLLMTHLCAPIAVIVTYNLAREAFPEDRTAALIAAAVVATSPFLAFTCGTLHNVTSSIGLVNGGLWLLVRGVRRSSFTAAFGAGLLFGLGLHSRTVNALAYGFSSGVIALVAAIKYKKRPIRLALAFALGLLPGIALYLFINYTITGNPLMTPAQLSMPPDMKIIGFGAGIAHNVPHTPILAFGKAGTNLLRLTMWVWGSLFGIVGLLGLALGVRKRRGDLLLLVPVFVLFFCYYFFYTSPGFDTGPLYYLDTLPIVALAMGRVASVLLERAEAPGALATRPQLTRIMVAGGVAAVLVALCTYWPVQGLAANKITDNTMLPYRAVEKAGIHHAVVWFNGNPWRRSWSLPPKPPKPDLSDDVLYARYDSKWAERMWEKYHHTRKFYRLRFDADRTWVEPWEYRPIDLQYGPPRPYIYDLGSVPR